MAKPEWGLKRTCQSCGVRFYDLKRSPIQCPKCDAKFDPNLAPRSHRPVVAAAKRKTAVSAKLLPEIKSVRVDDMPLSDADDDVEILVDADDDGVVVDVDEVDGGEEDLIEDASDLGGDEEDMAEVMEHMEDDVNDS